MADGAFDPAMIEQMVPMKRAGTPRKWRRWWPSWRRDEAGYITGQVISINGGMI